MFDTTATECVGNTARPRKIACVYQCDQSVFWPNTAIQAAQRKKNGEYTTQQKDNDSRMISASQLLFNTKQAGRTVTAAQALIPASS
jgi:hypothetical protein